MSTTVTSAPAPTLPQPGPAAAPPGPQPMSLPMMLGVTTALGIGIGALLLRPRGVGGGAALLQGMARGAAGGAASGVALFGIDRLTGGEVSHQLDLVFLNRRAQVGYLLRNLGKPWLGPLCLDVAGDARAAQRELYGRHDPRDGGQDAFRHAYGSAVLALRVMRDHGLSAQEAHRLAREAGEAHEADGQDNDEFSRAMDHANNLAGLDLVGIGRDANGAWLTEQAMRERALDALASGRLVVVDRSTTPAQLRASTHADLPAA